MTIKRLSGLLMFFGIVLFSYAAANAQETTPATPPTTKPQVVVTDPLANPPAADQQAAKPTSTSKKFGNYSVNVTETVTGVNLENGKYYTVTKWDGTKWVTKREWMPNKAAAAPPNQ